MRSSIGVIESQKFVFHCENSRNSCILPHHAFLFVLIEKCLKLFTMEQNWPDTSEVWYLTPGAQVQVAHKSDSMRVSVIPLPKNGHIVQSNPPSVWLGNPFFILSQLPMPFPSRDYTNPLQAQSYLYPCLRTIFCFGKERVPFGWHLP